MRFATFQHRLLVLLASIALVGLSAAGAAASQAGFVYTLVAGSGPNQIFGYSLDPLTGTLAPLPGFPVATGGDGFLSNATELMAYASGRLHVINQTSGTLSVFTVNKSTGALTALGSPISIGVGNGFCVAVHPNGSPVVVGISSSQFASFVVTPTSVTAAPGSPFAAGAADPISCTFSRDGNFVYGGGTGASPNLIAGFSVNADTGVLTPLAGSPFDAGGSLTRAYAMDSIGRLFLAQFEAVRAFTTPGGVPTAVTGNPFAGLSGVSDGLVHTAGLLHPRAGDPQSGRGLSNHWQRQRDDAERGGRLSVRGAWNIHQWSGVDDGRGASGRQRQQPQSRGVSGRCHDRQPDIAVRPAHRHAGDQRPAHGTGVRAGHHARRPQRRRAQRRPLAQQNQRPEHRLADERAGGVERGESADDCRHELGRARSRRRQRRRTKRCALAQPRHGPEHRLADERAHRLGGVFPADDCRYELGHSGCRGRRCGRQRRRHLAQPDRPARTSAG